MHFLIAPNAFKNSINASEAADAILVGLQQSKLTFTASCFPVGDGGDGTAFLLAHHLHGTNVLVEVHDPLQRLITSSYSLVDNNKTAVIELADASGLRLLHPYEYDPLITTTYGTGELIKHALNAGVEKIILCIGGSATVDGGTGILRALGVKFSDDRGNEIISPRDIIHLSAIDTNLLDTRIKNTEFIILCDVENALLGEEGAAKVFAPQKGANGHAVTELEQALTRFSNLTLQQTGINISTSKHGGAAGGVAAGLAAFLNAKLITGIDYFLDITNFNNALKNVDIVITGEGSIDEQTLQGKAPYGVALRAKQNNIPVIGLAGRVPLQTNNLLQPYFEVMLAINNGVSTLENAISHTKQNLIRTAKALGDLLALKLQ